MQHQNSFLRRAGSRRATHPTRSLQLRAACCEALEQRALLSATPGSLNPSFGGNGIAVAGGAFTQLNALAALPGGKEVVVGQADNGFGLEKLNSDGSLDKTFGNGTGTVITHFTSGGGEGDAADAVSVLAGGKLLVAGQASGGSGGFALARYNPDGSLDKSFGSAGLVRTNFGGSDSAAAIAVMADGRFVVAGTDQFDLGGGNTGDRFTLARYNANGSLDKTFGTAGKVTTDFGDHFDSAGAVLVTPAGAVYVAGSANRASFFSGHASFALARYTPAGQLDRSFNHGIGFVTSSFGPNDAGSSGVGLCQASTITLGRDGKITLAGTVEFVSNLDDHLAMARYNADGSPDTHFGKGGSLVAAGGGSYRTGIISVTPGGGYLYADGVDLLRYDVNGSSLAPFAGSGAHPAFTNGQLTAVGVASDGKILITGNSALADSRPAVGRFNADGSVDRSFSPGGGYTLVSTQGSPFEAAPADAEAVLSNGDILTAGSAYAPSSLNLGFSLIRYTPNGRPDPTFGGGMGIGVAGVPGNGSVESAPAMAVLPNGHVLIAGTVQVGSALIEAFAAAEFLPDGHLDLSFGRGGVITTPLPGRAFAAALAVLPNGRFVIAGTTVSGSHSHFILVRYYPNGTVDNTFGSGGVSVTAEAPTPPPARWPCSPATTCWWPAPSAATSASSATTPTARWTRASVSPAPAASPPASSPRLFSASETPPAPSPCCPAASSSSQATPGPA